jgi:two-component system, LytTR family, response regulator LytT
MIKVVIIEDEKLTAKDLANTIKQIEPSYTIDAVLYSVAEAKEYFNASNDTQLIFSDIELGDGKSFEIFESCNINIPIIFCTAYNEYALQAFETAGISYILKPFSTETVAKAIEKFKAIQPKINNAVDYTALLATMQATLAPTKLPNIIVHKGEKIIPISGKDIALFYIEHSAVKALTFEKTTVAVSLTLDELEAKFSPNFFRINRQFLVSRTAVTEASQHFNRKLLVHLNIVFGEQILVGKEKTGPFMQWLAEV